MEYAAFGSVSDDVIEDLKAIKLADARGELRGGPVRVVRDADGRRRVVPAVDPPRRHATVSSPSRTPVPSRPTQPTDQPRPAAAYPFGVLVDLQGTSDDRRRQRLRQAELELEMSCLRGGVDRARRLRRAEDSVYRDTVARFGEAILRPAR